jgi:trk system potassium uptake protein TrkA
VICPEESLTSYIRKLIEYPEALQVLEFSRGVRSLIAVRAVTGGPMVRHVISELPQLVPNVEMRFVAIYRTDTELGQDHQLVCDGTTRIEPGDEVFVLAATTHPPRARCAAPARRAGAPRDDRRRRPRRAAPGARDPGRLPGQDDRVEPERCEYLTTQLPSDALVLQGDSTDEELLERRTCRMDLFLALTSDDEDNIMACLLAKRMGARRVLALINRRAYADLVQGTQIDIALSPAQTVIGELLAMCGAATWPPCTACAAAPPKRWRRWPGATASPRRWWGGASTRSAAVRRADRRHRARRSTMPRSTSAS